MKRNSLFQNALFSLIVVIVAYGCSTPTKITVNPEPAKQEPVVEKLQSCSIIFTIQHVEVTKEAQHFVQGFDLENFRPIMRKCAPNIGYSFVIVSYGIKNPLAIEARLKRSEFVLIDRSGSSAEMVYSTSYDSSPSKLIWDYYTSRTLPPHFQGEDKELFIVEDDFIQGSKLIFYDKQYPLQLSILSM